MPTWAVVTARKTGQCCLWTFLWCYKTTLTTTTQHSLFIKHSNLSTLGVAIISAGMSGTYSGRLIGLQGCGQGCNNALRTATTHSRLCQYCIINFQQKQHSIKFSSSLLVIVYFQQKMPPWLWFIRENRVYLVCTQFLWLNCIVRTISGYWFIAPLRMQPGVCGNPYTWYAAYEMLHLLDK